MNVITRLKIANDKNFKVGDLVKIIEVTDQDRQHKRYCINNGITVGTVMKVNRITKKTIDSEYCDKEDRIICDIVNKDYCISLQKLNDSNYITHSCYTTFRKIDKDEYKKI